VNGQDGGNQPASRRARSAWIAALGAWVLYSVIYALTNWPARAFPAGTSDVRIFGDSVNIPGLFHALAAYGLAALEVAAILAIFLGAGIPAKLFRPKGVDRGDGFALRIASGMGVLALISQGMGLCGLYSGWLLAAVHIALLAGGAWWLWREGKVNWRGLTSSGGLFPAAMTLGLLLVVFFVTRTPIVLEDAMTVHWAAPEQYLHLHKIHAEPQQTWWHTALGGELLYPGFLWMGGIAMAKQVNFAALVVLLLVMFRMGRACNGDRDSPWWPAFWTVSCGMLVSACVMFKYNNILAAYLAAALWCAARGFVSGRAWWYPALWFLGLAYGAKISAAFGLVGVFVPLLAYGLWRLAPADLAKCALLGLVPSAPWLAQSFLFMGNPTYPFFSSIFPSLMWEPGYEAAIPPRSTGFHISPRFMLDFTVALKGTFACQLVGTIGLMALLPAVFLARRGPAARFVRAAALVSLVAWLASQRVFGYIAPVIYWTAVLATPAALEALAGRRFRWAYAALAVFTFASAAYVMVGKLVCRDELRCLLGQATAAQVERDSYTSWFDMRGWVRANVPPRPRLLFTGEVRRVGFANRIFSNGIVGQPQCWQMVNESFNTAELRKKYRQYGIGYNVHNFMMEEYRRTHWFQGPEWDLRMLVLYRDFIARYFRILYLPQRVDKDNGGFYIFEVMDRPHPPGQVFVMPQSESYFLDVWDRYVLGDFRVASATLARAEKYIGDVFQVQLIRGTILFGKRDWEGVYNTLRKGIRSGFISIWAGSNVGYYGSAAVNTGRFDEGIRYMEKAYEIHGEIEGLESIGLAYLARGQARAGKGDASGAAADVTKALEYLKDGPMRADASRLLTRIEMMRK